MKMWSGRVAQAAGTYAEHAPVATACCNACRTCATTNIVGLVLAAATSAAYGGARLLRRARRVT